MEQILQPVELANPWRKAALVAGAVAALELVALVAAGVLLVGRPLARSLHRAATTTHAAPAAPTRAAAKAPPARVHLTRAQTRVLVLNGNGTSGAAAAEADHVMTLGYAIGATGNTRPTPRTMVMYRPGFRGEGLRLGRDLGVRLVGPLDGVRSRDLSGSQVVLVLGSASRT